MGVGLIFLPRFFIKGFSEVDINPIIIGMLRGAGGSILPYSLLYIMIALNPSFYRVPIAIGRKKPRQRRTPSTTNSFSLHELVFETIQTDRNFYRNLESHNKVRIFVLN
jgi:hypothetical protein